MRIIAIRRLRDYGERHPAAAGPLQAWVREVGQAQWSTPAQLKDRFPKARILKDNRVVFDIAGNQYRLIVWLNYRHQAVYIKWVGTHAEYDRIDAQEVGL